MEAIIHQKKKIIKMDNLFFTFGHSLNDNLSGTGFYFVGQMLRGVRLLVLFYCIIILLFTPLKSAKLLIPLHFLSLIGAAAPVVLYLEPSPPPISFVNIIFSFCVPIFALIVTYKARGDWKKKQHQEK